ncbi:hypothetical protein BDZ45DRAFT_692158 [Acephala macrosclerotiorum]|nr:hypothetical protein BDZ45DRAFT_692158 [Acephala macrosclerotiorum]
MPQYFSALPSPLTPPGKKSQTTSCTEFSALSPALLDRRATQKPLPEKVSPLTRLAVSNASPRKARKFLNDNYLERKHQYHHGGQLSYDYVKPLEHARSPKLKIGKETEGEVNKAELKTIEDMAARKLDMTKTSLVAEINEKREMLKVKNAEWAEKVSRVHESKEMFKMVKRRNAEWAEKASRLREARRVRENTDVKSDLSENATTSSPNTQSSTPGPKVLASAPVIPVKSR